MVADVFLISTGCGPNPLPVTVVNKGFFWIPYQNVIDLVVTVTAKGPHPIYQGFILIINNIKV